MWRLTDGWLLNWKIYNNHGGFKFINVSLRIYGERGRQDNGINSNGKAEKMYE